MSVLLCRITEFENTTMQDSLLLNITVELHLLHHLGCNFFQFQKMTSCIFNKGNSTVLFMRLASLFQDGLKHQSSVLQF